MTVKHQQSTSITNRQAVPVVPNATGAGAEGYVKNVSDSVVVVAASAADSTLRILRVPTNAKIKQIWLSAAAQGAGAFDIGVYYPVDGPTGKADLAANAISQAFFASAVDCSAAVEKDVTNESGTYTADLKNLPLWKALALASDPGGEFDIVATVKTTDVTTGAAVLGLAVDFVM
jgi:hypothetical protein